MFLLVVCACATVITAQHHVHVHFDESEVENAINVAAARVKTQLERSKDTGKLPGRGREGKNRCSLATNASVTQLT